MKQINLAIRMNFQQSLWCNAYYLTGILHYFRKGSFNFSQTVMSFSYKAIVFRFAILLLEAEHLWKAHFKFKLAIFLYLFIVNNNTILWTLTELSLWIIQSPCSFSLAFSCTPYLFITQIKRTKYNKDETANL